jgi:hypothetical protein
MKRVSTNLTLFYKFFIPIFWIVFFGATTLAVLFLEYEAIGDIPANNFKIGTVLFFLTGIIFFYWALLGLKRVEMDEQFVYVTNYFKTARYPYHQVDRITVGSFPIFHPITINLKNKGIFGKKITFVPSRKKFSFILEKYPHVFEGIMEDEF